MQKEDYIKKTLETKETIRTLYKKVIKEKSFQTTKPIVGQELFSAIGQVEQAIDTFVSSLSKLEEEAVEKSKQDNTKGLGGELERLKNSLPTQQWEELQADCLKIFQQQAAKGLDINSNKIVYYLKFTKEQEQDAKAYFKLLHKFTKNKTESYNFQINNYIFEKLRNTDKNEVLISKCKTGTPNEFNRELIYQTIYNSFNITNHKTLEKITNDILSSKEFQDNPREFTYQYFKYTIKPCISIEMQGQDILENLRACQNSHNNSLAEVRHTITINKK